LRRFDGIATRIGWQPTRIHREFIALLRAEAGAAAVSAQPGRASRARIPNPRRRAAGARVKTRTDIRNAVSHMP
jgi:hypothetical protein